MSGHFLALIPLSRRTARPSGSPCTPPDSEAREALSGRTASQQLENAGRLEMRTLSWFVIGILGFAFGAFVLLTTILLLWPTALLIDVTPTTLTP